jgi:hypothetical protein
MPSWHQDPQQEPQAKNGSLFGLLLFVAGLMTVVLVLVLPARGETPPISHTIPASEPAAMFQGHSALWWAHRTTYWKREAIDRGRILRARGTVREAINLACTIYGNCSTLWRKARCETGGSFNPYSLNRSSYASGLFQFLGSTWRSTPFGGFSVWSPYANALAAGWMHTHGRSGEWVCR